MNIESLDQSQLLRWWQLYMIQVFRQESDLIRNGALQDLFALRRRLELSGQARLNTEEDQVEHHLAQLEKIYAQLEAFCDRIDPSHLEDSLPLALFHAVKPCQRRLCLSLDLPHTWEPEPIELTWLLTLWAKSLSQALSQEGVLPEECHLTLQYQEAVPSLTFCARYADLVPSSLAVETTSVLSPMLETFRILANGECQQHSQSHSYTWVLLWNANPSSL